MFGFSGDASVLCREESCACPEAMTSEERLLPPARAQGFGTSCGLTAITKITLPEIPRRRLTLFYDTSDHQLLTIILVPEVTRVYHLGNRRYWCRYRHRFRYGHRVSFLRSDRRAAAPPITVLENREGYHALEVLLRNFHLHHPTAQFHVHIDAAGQYAANLEQFLRGLDLPMTISIGEPKRNKDYQKSPLPQTHNRRHRESGDSSLRRRRALRGHTSTLGLHGPAPQKSAAGCRPRSKQTTQAVNRLRNLMARAFHRAATLTDDIAVSWVLRLLQKYPTAERIAGAHLDSLVKIPYLFP